VGDERNDSATDGPAEGRPYRRLSRRAAFGAIGAAAAAVGDSSPTSPSSTSSTDTTTTSTNATCAVTPTETIGPYPSRTDMFRSDVRENRQGTPLTLTIKVVNVGSACAAVAGADVEIWHVDAAGDYSQYGSQTAATFLRGIQTTNAAGEVTFTTIYPGWYQGRATHIHVEVTMSGRSIKVTQMAFPETINNTVHTSGVYAARGTNPMSNQSDGIFADSLSSEIVTPAGSPSGGYSATFQVGVSV
jgi:protocatechuate 3,4-dioxygenase beta subunit